ncbi:MAG TPA: acyltransferase [Phenylobacterium sp.]|nr:acyltransferase [Phenylobacterium sp.]
MHPRSVKLWSLQVLRFWAALAVVHLHAVQRAMEATGEPGVLGFAGAVIGRAGVDVFFVLSGVIITLTARGLTPGEFAWKRVRRIAPLYLLLSAPWIVLWMAAGPVDARELTASVTLWPAFDRMAAPLLPVGWTLCFEALFYAAVTLILWRRWLVAPLLALWATAAIVGVVPVFQFLGNPIILEFLAGVALAFAPRWRPLVWALPAGVAAILVGAALQWPPTGSALAFLRGDEAWVRLATLGVPAALIVAGALQLRARPGVMAYLGDASYALYLVHPLVLLAIPVALKLTGARVPPDVLIVTGMALSVVAAWRIHEAVEKPILAHLSRRAIAPRLTPTSAD